jgi:hypothetical protein
MEDNNSSSSSHPILVRAAVPEDEAPEEATVDAVTNPGQQTSLSVPIPVEILNAITQNTTVLQDKLNNFVNGINSKIQSVWHFTLYLALNVLTCHSGRHERMPWCKLIKHTRSERLPKLNIAQSL